jgi:hypothetical protein
LRRQQELLEREHDLLEREHAIFAREQYLQSREWEVLKGEHRLKTKETVQALTLSEPIDNLLYAIPPTLIADLLNNDLVIQLAPEDWVALDRIVPQQRQLWLTLSFLLPSAQGEATSCRSYLRVNALV